MVLAAKNIGQCVVVLQVRSGGVSRLRYAGFITRLRTWGIGAAPAHVLPEPELKDDGTQAIWCRILYRQRDQKYCWKNCAI